MLASGPHDGWEFWVENPSQWNQLVFVAVAAAGTHHPVNIVELIGSLSDGDLIVSSALPCSQESESSMIKKWL